jgi:hypothetical protein
MQSLSKTARRQTAGSNSKKVNAALLAALIANA